jgi:hypothetical protein
MRCRKPFAQILQKKRLRLMEICRQPIGMVAARLHGASNGLDYGPARQIEAGDVKTSQSAVIIVIILERSCLWRIGT